MPSGRTLILPNVVRASGPYFLQKHMVKAHFLMLQPNTLFYYAKLSLLQASKQAECQIKTIYYRETFQIIRPSRSLQPQDLINCLQ